MLNKDDHFPEVGAPTLQRRRQHTILPNLPQNYKKLKEFEPLGSSLRPFRSTTGLCTATSVTFDKFPFFPK